MENEETPKESRCLPLTSIDLLDRRLEIATNALKEISKTIQVAPGQHQIPFGFEARDFAENTLREMEAV